MASSDSGTLNEGQRKLLDTYRGLAAQGVLLHHASTYFLPNSRLEHARLGDLGVTVFFVLSGFLITSNVLDRIEAGRFTFAEFFISRFARIYCTYIPAILFVAFVDNVSSHSAFYPFKADYNVATAVANLTMLQGFPPLLVMQTVLHHTAGLLFGTFGSAVPFWTICIEWWIYMTVGLIAVIICRGLSRLVLAALAFAAIWPVFFITVGLGNCLTLTWILGGVAAVAFRSAWGARVLRPTSVAGVRQVQAVAVGAGVLLMLRLIGTHGAFFDPLVATLLAVLMFSALFATRRPGLVSAVLRRLSFQSYSLYLIHGTVLVFILCIFPGFGGWPAIGVGVLVANLIAVPFAALFELPHKALRRLLLSLWETLQARGQARTA